MSALLTHAAVGVLLALALRWPIKWLPLAALLAALPDVDHVLPGTVARVTLHNAFFCIALPLATWGTLRWRGADPQARLAAGSALLLTSHLLLDMIPLDPLGAWGSVALFYPFSGEQWMLPLWKANTLDPLAITAMTLLVALLIALVGLARGIERPAEARGRMLVPSLAVLWLLLFPIGAAAGLVVERPDWSPAHLAIEDAFLDLPEGRVVGTIFHAGGDRAHSIRLELVANGTPIANVSAQRSLMPGERATLSMIAGDAPRNLTWISLRLVGIDDHLYGITPVSTRRGHFDTPITFEREETNASTARVIVLNGGDRPIPWGSLEIRAVGSDAPRQILGAITPRGSAIVEIPPAYSDHRLELRARDDGFVYDSIDAGAR